MPRVTIGVPVYNSEKLLETALDNLAGQTFKDFQVIVLDNASTDGTGEIAERFAARDARFVYRRQPRNVGALKNFIDVLAMADTPFFAWRADDDYSDANFLAVTIRLLDGEPTAVLGVGRAILEKRGRRRFRPFPQRWPLEPDASYRVRLLLRSRASWIYGLFRTEDLRASMSDVQAGFPHVNAFDHLVLLPFLLTLRVAGSNDTSFVTGFVEKPGSASKKGFIDPREMATLRRDFLSYCRATIAKVIKNPVTRACMQPVLWLYAERTYRWLKVLDAQRRLLMGETPTGATRKYD